MMSIKTTTVGILCLLAVNFTNSSQGDRLAWCDNAYSPSSDPNAPVNKEYEGVITNAPSLSTNPTAASVHAYSQWISGCAAGLLMTKG
jgi:hypothetical protein